MILIWYSRSHRKTSLTYYDLLGKLRDLLYCEMTFCKQKKCNKMLCAHQTWKLPHLNSPALNMLCLVLHIFLRLSRLFNCVWSFGDWGCGFWVGVRLFSHHVLFGLKVFNQQNDSKKSLTLEVLLVVDFWYIVVTVLYITSSINHNKTVSHN